MDLAEAYVGPMIDAIYRRLIDRDFALEDPEVVMLLTALINILGHDNRGDRPTEVLLMAAYGERGVLDRPNMRVMRWRNGALSGSDLANEPGLGSSRTYQPGEMPMPSKPKPGLTRMHREMNSEATSPGSPLRAAVPPKRAKVGQEVQTNQTMQGLDEMNEELKSTKKELDEMTRSMLQMEEDRDMWRKLFEDCNKKQGQEIERLRQEYKERSEQMALTTAVEKVIPARDIPRGQSPMELLTPREMSQTTETRPPVETNRVTIPDPSDTLGDPVVEQTVRKLIETAGRLVANKSAPGSGVTALGFYSMFGSLESLLNLEQKHEVVTAISVEVFPGVLQTEQKYIGKWREAIETEMNIRHSETYCRPSGARYLVGSTLAPMCKSRYPVHFVAVDVKSTRTIVDQTFSVPMCVRLARMSEKSYELLCKMFSAVPERTKEELESILGKKFMGYVSGNFSDFERQKQRGSTVTDYNAVDENDEVHRVMMEVEPLLEASGKRNWRSIIMTHDEFPCHCLLQTWWYPKRSNLMLIWDSGELLSMGLPDSSQPVTIVIVGVMMAIRWLEAHVRENNRQEAPTREQLRKLDCLKI